ncbi:MAG TPA: sialate O-acetylesterase [Chloroflexota bacterium]|nr:sialate O-acetylesterase [Chloroflexota bacterium]
MKAGVPTRIAGAWGLPRVRARVFIIWGQSNGRGRAPLAELPAQMAGGMSGAYFWNPGTTSFRTLEAKTMSGNPDAGLDWGCEMPLALKARAAYNSPIYIIKYAPGGVPLVTTTAPTWNPNVTGSLYSTARTQLSDALAAIPAGGYNIEGALWMQGEADAANLETRANYAARLTELFAGLRAGAGVPSLRIVDMLIRGTSVAQNAINDAKGDVRAAGHNIKLVDARPLSALTDEVHLNGAGQVAFADQAFAFLGPR